MNLKNRSAISIIEKKVSVIGLGKSGYAATILAHYLGGKVFASDLGNTTEILYRASQLRQKGINCETAVMARALGSVKSGNRCRKMRQNESKNGHFLYPFLDASQNPKYTI